MTKDLNREGSDSSLGNFSSVPPSKTKQNKKTVFLCLKPFWGEKV